MYVILLNVLLKDLLFIESEVTEGTCRAVNKTLTSDRFGSYIGIVDPLPLCTTKSWSRIPKVLPKLKP